mgnify:CR=1 FL=1
MDNLYFRVADMNFQIEFLDEEDNRNMLPSFPVFHYHALKILKRGGL